MLQLILRGLAAGILVVGVAEIARLFPRLGAMILTLPIVIPVVFLVMYMRDGQVGPIARLARETLVLIPLGLPFFIPMAFAPRWGISFWTAFSAGLGAVAILVMFYLWLNPGGQP